MRPLWSEVRLPKSPDFPKRFGSAGVKLLLLLCSLVLTLAIFRLPLLYSLQLILSGAFGDRFAWSRTVVKATPLLLTGLGVTVAWRAGAYNIGGEGQFVVGGLASAAIAKLLIPFHMGPGCTFLMVIASISGGALWAGIAGWLQVKRGVEAVISTILLNFIALQLMGWLIEGPLQESSHRLPQTDELPTALMLYRPNPQMDLNLGTLFAVAAACGVWIYLFNTVRGYRLRVSGSNPFAARAAKLNPNGARLEAFLVSGGLCGLAGGVDYAGVAGLIGKGFNQNWGFLGIPVALLAGLNPLTLIPAALYFGALLSGSENLSRFTAGGPTLVAFIQGIAVLSFLAVGAIRIPRSFLGKLRWN